MIAAVALALLHVIGDSQACGVGLVAPKDAVITCKGGTRTPYWVTHVEDAKVKPGDEVIVFLGSNDWGEVDARPILKALKGTRCVWVGPPLIRGKDNGVADRLKRQVEEDGTCRFLDSRPLKLAQPDGVHTSEPGRWLKAALSLLRSGGW